MLVVVTPAASSALTTIDAVRARGVSEQTDAMITAAIDEASSRVAGYCGREFGETAYRQTERGVCANGIVLAAAGPIVSLQSVVSDGAAMTEDTDFERDGFDLYRLASDRRIFWSASKVVVEYTCGWKLPGETVRNLPPAIEAACLALVTRGFAAGDRDPELVSESIAGVSRLEYAPFGSQKGAPSKDGMPADVAAMLDPFVCRTLA